MQNILHNAKNFIFNFFKTWELTFLYTLISCSSSYRKFFYREIYLPCKLNCNRFFNKLFLTKKGLKIRFKVNSCGFKFDLVENFDLYLVLLFYLCRLKQVFILTIAILHLTHKILYCKKNLIKNCYININFLREPLKVLSNCVNIIVSM